MPALPFNTPRREFGIYSWLALFQSQVRGLGCVRSMHKRQPVIDTQELRFEAADDLDKFMSLDKLEESFSDKRVKFVLEKGEIWIFRTVTLTLFADRFIL